MHNQLFKTDLQSALLQRGCAGTAEHHKFSGSVRVYPPRRVPCSALWSKHFVKAAANFTNCHIRGQVWSHFAICHLDSKSLKFRVKLRMSINYILLTIIVIILATGNTQAADADAGTRHLRSVDKTDAQDEERANLFEYTFFDKLFKGRLPEQFEKMRTQPASRDYYFASWRQGWMSYVDVIEYMEKQGLPVEAISRFLAAYDAYLLKHPFLTRS